jgi:hypothetical protein
MAPQAEQPAAASSARSSLTVGQDEQLNVPGIPAKERFTDDSKYPFMTARTFCMTILVSMGGICFGYDTGQISGFLQMEDFRYQVCLRSRARVSPGNCARLLRETCRE